MALLRSAARALRLRQPLARSPVEGLSPRLLSSSVPTERHNSSDPRPRDTMERTRHINGKNEDILQRISMKVDKVSGGLDRHSRLLQELEVHINNNNKRDLTPAVVLVSASLLSFVLYKYVQSG